MGTSTRDVGLGLAEAGCVVTPGSAEGPMIAAVLVVLAGLGIGALGLLAADLYVVGLVVVFIGGIGVLVAFGDWLQRFRAARR